MTSKQDRDSLGAILVIGGCGFVGFHVVKKLLQDPSNGPIFVVSRSPEANHLEGVTYRKGDIGNIEEVRRLLDEIQPCIIFHTAAPRADDPTILPAEHFRVSVEGTKNVLKCAQECVVVKALIYTSTCAVSEGYQHRNIDETAPLWKQDSKAIPYVKAKALADTLVCNANSPLDAEGQGLLTATLRLAWTFGERDNQTIPGMLRTVEEAQTNVQLGSGQNLVDPTYMGNIATAHVLTAKKLLQSTKGSLQLKVDGEAFHITDGDPQPFWEFSRQLWRLAGDKTRPEKVTIVPGWLALSMARGLEWGYFLFTLGRVRPPLKMSLLYIQYTIYNSTYDISKARARLGYEPIVDKEAHLRSSIAWELENHSERYPRLLAK